MKPVLALVLAIVLLVSAFATIKYNFFTFASSADPIIGIQITSDGNVVGTDTISRKGETYTLLGDLSEPITIMRNNVTIDGKGHSIIGQGNPKGVYLRNVNYVTVKNLIVKNFDVGIDLSCMDLGSRNNTIEGNTLDADNTGILLGLNSMYNTVNANIIENGSSGISIDMSNRNILRDNLLSNNKYNLYIDTELTTGLVNDIDSSNLVNGKPVIYWVNEHDKVVPLNAGFVALIDCRNITVTNLKISNNSPGILIDQTNNTLVTENQLRDNYYGIIIKSYPRVPCDSNTVSNNRIIGNAIDGISIDSADFSLISKNTIMNSGEIGITIFDSKSTIISENNLVSSYQSGLKIWGQSSENVFTKNNFVDNAQHNFTNGDQSVSHTTVYGQAEIHNGTVEINSCNRNYWSDYSGSDLDRDGVGDSPYTTTSCKIVTHNGVSLIFEAYTHIDSPPLMYPWGSPILNINSPENGSFTSNTMPLNLTVIQLNSWIGYRLDGGELETFRANTTLDNLSIGTHSLVLYANDSYSNMDRETVSFTVETLQTPIETTATIPKINSSPVMLPIVLIVAVTIFVLILLVYFKKYRR